MTGVPNPRDNHRDPLREQLIDTAVARVFSNENVLKAYKRWGLTNSIRAQIIATWNYLTSTATEAPAAEVPYPFTFRERPAPVYSAPAEPQRSTDDGSSSALAIGLATAAVAYLALEGS